MCKSDRIALLVWLMLAAAPGFAQSLEESPRLVLPQRHSGGINAIAVSPDGKWFASGASDNTIRIWALPQGIHLRTILTGAAAIRSIAIDPAGKRIAAGFDDGAVQMWNTRSGALVGGRVQLDAGAVDNVVFSPNGRWLAIRGFNLYVLDLQSNARWMMEGKAVRRARHSNQQIVFTPDSKKLVAVDLTDDLGVWEVESGKLLKSIPSSGNSWTSLAVSPNGGFTAAGSREGVVRVWNSADWTTASADLNCGKPVGSIFFGTSGETLFTAAELEVPTPTPGGRLEVWAWKTGTKTGSLPFHAGDSNLSLEDETPADRFTAMAPSPDRRFLLLGFLADIKIWDLGQLALLKRIGGRFQGGLLSHMDANGGLIASSTSGAPILWHIAEGVQSAVLSNTGLESDESVYYSKYLGDGTGLAALVGTISDGRMHFSLCVWDTASGDEVHRVETSGLAMFLAASAQGERFAWIEAAGVNSPLDTVVIWNSASRQIEMRRPKADFGIRSIFSMEFSSDGSTLALGADDGTIRLIEPVSGRARVLDPRRESAGAAGVRSLWFAADSGRLISGQDDGTLRIWRPDTGTVLQTVRNGPAAVTLLSSNRQETRIAAASADHVVRVWRLSGDGTVVSTGSPIVSDSAVSSVNFAPDDSRLVVAAEESSLTWRKIETGDTVGTLYLDQTFGTKRWLASVPSGFFDASDGEWDEAVWRFGNDTFNWKPVNAYFDDFFQPGILAELRRGEVPAPRADIRSRNREAPVIRLSINPAWKPADRETEIRLELEVPRGGEARDVRLLRNGVLVQKWNGAQPVDAGNLAVLTARVRLVAGMNHFRAYAFNAANVSSPYAELSLTADRSIERAPALRILAVGIDRYRRLPKLQFAVADARLLVDALAEHQQKQWQFVPPSVQVLYNDQATKRNILSELRNLAAKSEPEDTVIIFFATHGTAEPGRFYILPHDAAMVREGSRWTDSAISDRELEQVLTPMDAAHIMLVLDTCRSGQALKSGDDRRTGPINSSGLAQLAYEKGITLLAAAQDYQNALELQRFGHGLLTYALVREGLQEGKADRAPKDGTLTWSEWVSYALERVPELQSAATQSRGVRPTAVGASMQRPAAFIKSEEENDRVEWNVFDRSSLALQFDSLPPGIPRSSSRGAIRILVWAASTPKELKLLASLQKIASQSGTPPVEVYGITPLAQAEVDRTLAGRGIKFPVVSDRTPKSYLGFGICEPCLLPYMILLRPDGTLFARIWGYRTAELLQQAVRMAANPGRAQRTRGQ